MQTLSRTEPAGEVLDASQLLKSLTALQKGDFSQKMPMGVDGLTGKVYDVVNGILEMNTELVREIRKLSAAIGKEGKIMLRAQRGSFAGTWGDCIDYVNELIGDLVQPTSEVGRVIGAVARGDLSQTMSLESEGRPLKGEFIRTAKIVNGMVNQLSSFASEVTRVAREVGTEGKLGGQAVVRDVSGIWKDLTDNVNSMASNLTSQVRNIAQVTTAVATGDLSKKITVDVKGEILELKNTINTMVDQLSSFASEVTRVAREVGTEGKLGGQAVVRGVGGTWKDLTDNVNSMASNLTAQVRDIAQVTTAVANGDLSKTITVDVKGEILALKNTINTMVDQLSSFASEVTRVAREVGTEGKLGGQAVVKGVGGTWKDLTDNVNSMASNLTAQVRDIAQVTTAVATGDLSKKITVDVKGEILELKNTINTMVDQLSSFASEVTRVAREVGTEGKLGGQAVVKGVTGTWWKDLTDNVNSMASNLTAQVRGIATVTTAVANGDLSKKITVDVKGEILELKNTINTMVDQLSSFASEVTRVAREVGTEGKLGGQAVVKGVAGTWKDLTDNVNSMASNLTAQVRGIATVVTGVANGDLKRKLVLETKGEIAALSDTINGMIDILALFGDQVTSVAREVGIEGKLGGQARVPGAAGLWRNLTDNVNQLAGNLTTQVRAIATVATAVTKGDLSRSITVEAQGEVASLKDNINEMIRNLKETTRINTEQDWLKTNLAKFTRLLQGQRDLVNVSRLILSELAPLVNAQHGVFYVTGISAERPMLRLLASYAYKERKNLASEFAFGEGLVGQCAMEKERILLTDVPENYIHISSGLGASRPSNIVVIPVLFEGQVKAVIELASFQRFTDIHLSFLDQLTESIGIVLNTIAAGMRTEELLKQSQTLTEELQGRQEELTSTNSRLEEQARSLQTSEELLKRQQEEMQRKNEELEEKAELLARQKHEVEQKNFEVEEAKQALEEKAEQLSVTSRYKSEFLANMSHEIRTPLNSILILSRLMSENSDGNLSGKQVEYTRTIHSSGTDLLGLINDILDLSKIESGRMSVELDEVSFEEIHNGLERTFSEVAAAKKLRLKIERKTGLPPIIRTDIKRLQQILKNLLSNAFKFTERGEVLVRMEQVGSGWDSQQAVLKRAESVIAFSVKDTGIGIPKEKHAIIFEAFQQADGTTSRKYGGTGLGLSISREIAHMLGGEIYLRSEVGEGSTFTLYLPAAYSQLENAELAPIAHSGLGTSVKTERMVSSELGIAGTGPLILDDRTDIGPGDKPMLIHSGDAAFGNDLLGPARESGFKVIVAGSDEDGAIATLRHYNAVAMVIDIESAGSSVWTLIDRMKHSAETRHIPIVAVSSRSEELQRAARLGAWAWIEKRSIGALQRLFVELMQFLTRTHTLWIAADEAKADLTRLLRGTGAELAIKTGTRNNTKNIDCIVVPADAQHSDSFLKGRSSQRHKTALVVYGNANAHETRTSLLNGKANDPSVSYARNESQLFERITLALHGDVRGWEEPARQKLEQIFQRAEGLTGATVHIVDDDIRNVFALTSVLEKYRMKVSYSDNGQHAVSYLKKHPETEVVLMDIMMPGKDGYETMREIRSLEILKNLPIIALTAKAMKGDREKCIEAGASDYITKPVETDRLISLIRSWVDR